MDYIKLFGQLFNTAPEEREKASKEKEKTFERSIAEVVKEVKKIYDAFVKAGLDEMDAFELTKALYIFILNKA